MILARVGALGRRGMDVMHHYLMHHQLIDENWTSHRQRRSALWMSIQQSTNAAAGHNRREGVLGVSMHGLGVGGRCMEEQEEATGRGCHGFVHFCTRVAVSLHELLLGYPTS